MKMSEKAFKKFDSFCKLALEKATDDDVDFIINSVVKAAAAKKKKEAGVDFSDINPTMSKKYFDMLVEFFKEFLSTASDMEAIYLLSCISAICKNAIEHPKEVSDFVESVKNKGTN